jgi:hypothetical protein
MSPIYAVNGQASSGKWERNPPSSNRQLQNLPASGKFSECLHGVARLRCHQILVHRVVPLGIQLAVRLGSIFLHGPSSSCSGARPAAYLKTEMIGFQGNHLPLRMIALR